MFLEELKAEEQGIRAPFIVFERLAMSGCFSGQLHDQAIPPSQKHRSVSSHTLGMCV
jgi:hypothetical protein